MCQSCTVTLTLTDAEKRFLHTKESWYIHLFVFLIYFNCCKFKVWGQTFASRKETFTVFLCFQTTISEPSQLSVNILQQPVCAAVISLILSFIQHCFVVVNRRDEQREKEKKELRKKGKKSWENEDMKLKESDRQTKRANNHRTEKLHV